MSEAKASNQRTAQAVFCVCADDSVVRAAQESTDSTEGAVFFGEFRDYITAEKRPQFSPTLKSAVTCVALVDFDKDPEQALVTADRLEAIFPKRISIIAVGSHLDAALLVRAMRAGCSEYLPKPVDAALLSHALTRFRERMTTTSETQSSLGRVLTFFGAKGGVGSTSLAVHLGTFLARHHAKRTLLIDHKHQLGHVALYLGLADTRYHFDELLRNVDRLDVELLNGYVLRHESGLDIIASPETATLQHEGKPEELERVMTFLRREYDYILIDSSVGYGVEKRSLIDQADEIYLVSTPDLASLRDLARLVESMSLTDLARSKLRLVLNRATANDSLGSEQIQKAIRFPVSISIPNSYLELVRAINEGRPILPTHKSPFTHQMLVWCNNLTGHSAQGGKIPAASAEASPKATKKKSLAFWR